MLFLNKYTITKKNNNFFKLFIQLKRISYSFYNNLLCLTVLSEPLLNKSYEGWVSDQHDPLLPNHPATHPRPAAQPSLTDIFLIDSALAFDE
jgi:hypothetical protein